MNMLTMRRIRNENKMKHVMDRIMGQLDSFAHYEKNYCMEDIESREAVVSLVLEAMNNAGLGLYDRLRGIHITNKREHAI